ncbi:hypothetical protein CI610_01931 [invertebrate metagenome]|uniref:DUF58 domain-containing protein n=1 Tax=invertebrate metagenome TaxID=1711999 RepID=A0A2H9T7C3_9ZZZZ
MSGAYSTLDDLVALRFQAKQLGALSRNSSTCQFAGNGKSPFKGRGIDFEEVRIYQPGDDIRAIDWRVTARRSKPHTKIFKEERERPVLVVVDQSLSLFFGSQLNFKSVTVAEAACLLIWATLFQGDRIGGLIFNDHDICEIRPKRSKKTAMQLIHHILSLNNNLSVHNKPTTITTDYLAKSLRHTRRIALPGTKIFILSDFAHIDDDANRQLAQLSKHCEVMALQVLDPMESELPPPGLYTITNGIHRHSINTSNTTFRQTYKHQAEQQQASLRSQFMRYKIKQIHLWTHTQTTDQLVIPGGISGQIKPKDVHH